MHNLVWILYESAFYSTRTLFISARKEKLRDVCDKQVFQLPCFQWILFGRQGGACQMIFSYLGRCARKGCGLALPPATTTLYARAFQRLLPTEVVQLREEGKAVLLDVREPPEHLALTIPGDDVFHAPLSGLGTMVDHDELVNALPEELQDKSTKVVVVCRSGKRSAFVANALERHGWKDVINLEGGVLAWATDVDPSIVRDPSKL
eukprot:g81547.t1